jgi:hypothetical protein
VRSTGSVSPRGKLSHDLFITIQLTGTRCFSLCFSVCALLLNTFAFLRRVYKPCFLVRPSLRMKTNAVQRNSFSLRLMLGSATNVCQCIPVLVQIEQQYRILITKIHFYILKLLSGKFPPEKLQPGIPRSFTCFKF